MFIAFNMCLYLRKCHQAGWPIAILLSTRKSMTFWACRGLDSICKPLNKFASLFLKDVNSFTTILYLFSYSFNVYLWTIYYIPSIYTIISGTVNIAMKKTYKNILDLNILFRKTK